MSVATRKYMLVYMYETMIPGGIGTKAFNPQLLINVSDHIDRKLDSINEYKSAFGLNIDNRFSKGRCRFRGEQIGVKYAEAFEIKRNKIMKAIIPVRASNKILPLTRLNQGDAPSCNKPTIQWVVEEAVDGIMILQLLPVITKIN